jgi:pyroglutamyl-peptidase
VILVTGFGSFPGVADNPTASLARALDGVSIDGVPVRASVLDVEFAQLSERLKELEALHQPDLILGLGVSGVAQKPTLELLGVNEVGEHADAAGEVPASLGSGPPELSVGLQYRAFQEVLGGVTSRNAGRYVCNAWLYTALRDLKTPALFLHVPSTGLALPLLRQGLKAWWRETRSGQ